jgi:hypothetical protein
MTLGRNYVYSFRIGLLGSASILTFSFSFKLFELQRLDQDGDGIPSYLEDLNGDGYVRVLATGVLILMIRMGMEFLIF